MKILVVHRQQEVVSQIKLVLQHAEPFIRYSDSGLDGLLAARVERFDLIICGIDLPVVTGYELIRSIRTASVNRATTVIFLADEIDHKAEVLGQALGVAGLFQKKDLDRGLLDIMEKSSNTASPAALNKTREN